MSIGLVGRKIGMTRIFKEDGDSVPVTVVEVQPNHVTQIKTTETDGYNAIQVTTGKRRASRVTKPMAGHFAKAKVEAGRGTWEFRLTAEEIANYELGSEVKLDTFTDGQLVDVTAKSKGKGFQGGVKRHNFRTQDATHGNSLAHRALGSTGQCQTPGRVFKGKKMAGQMGNVRKTVQNQELVQVDADRKLLLIKGNVPGGNGSDVIVRPAVKAGGEK